MALSMSVGRDYRTSSRYEYVIFEDEEVIAREGFFRSSAQAKRAGAKAAQRISETDQVTCPRCSSIGSVFVCGQAECPMPQRRIIRPRSQAHRELILDGMAKLEPSDPFARIE